MKRRDEKASRPPPSGSPRPVHQDTSRSVVLDRAGDLQLTPAPWGGGRTLRNWRVLAAAAARDLNVARLLEAHLDAVGICAGLGGPAPGPGELWGVWAARSAHDVLHAAVDGGGWRLTGSAPWCSGADRCTHALVTALAPDGDRLLAVDLARPGVAPDPSDAGTWRGLGMDRCGTATVRFDDVPARAVGEPGAYLARPGFWHGAVAVAAVWFGGAVGVAGPLRLRVGASATPDPHALAHAGAVDAALATSGAVLAGAAAAVDRPSARTEPVDEARRRALRVRTTVESGVDDILRRTGRATGPGPLAHEEEHARRVADLEVYLRQSHAERDLAVLGELSAASGVGAGVAAWL